MGSRMNHSRIYALPNLGARGLQTRLFIQPLHTINSTVVTYLFHVGMQVQFPIFQFFKSCAGALKNKKTEKPHHEIACEKEIVGKDHNLNIFFLLK